MAIEWKYQGFAFYFLDINTLRNLRGQQIYNRPWVDWRDLSAFRGESTSVTLLENTPPKLVEANGWIVYPDGKIELVAVVGKGRSH